MDLSGLRAAIVELGEADVSAVDGDALRDLRACLDSAELVFSSWTRAFQRAHGHLADGSPGVVSWLRQNCKMSGGSAAQRACVGLQLESSPEIGEAVRQGELGFQSAATVCRLLGQVGDKRSQLDEQALLDWAKQMDVAALQNLCRQVRYVVDPDGAERDDSFNFELRRLHISKTADGMHVLDAVLDAQGGAAVKAALESLAMSGPRDERKHKQRMADAIVELAHHALDSGVLPARKGARPHLNVSTTLDGLRGLPGGASIDGAPISIRTLERLACDCTVSRVLLAGSEVIDVGRATRTISPAARRALQARDRHCRFPGCDRPSNWTSAHHIEFWSRGGPTRLPNLVSLCHYHHRLVHEGGWQVVKVGDDVRFIAPERTASTPWRPRGPSDYLAA